MGTPLASCSILTTEDVHRLTREKREKLCATFSMLLGERILVKLMIIVCPKDVIIIW